MKYIKTNFVYNPCPLLPKHVHEVQGNVDITEIDGSSHNHNFVAVTEEAIPVGTSDHIHEVRFTTDTFDNHSHEFHGKTTGAIPVGDRHVHFLKAETEPCEGHNHKFRLVTFLDDTII